MTGAAAAGALRSGAGRLGGVLQSAVGQARTNLLPGRGNPSHTASTPSDGSRCEGCGDSFGVLRRRSTCGSCDRYLCAGCLGQGTLASLSGISCFCSNTCPRCREQNAQTGEFEANRAEMESGVSVMIGVPRKASGLLGRAQAALASGTGGAASLSGLAPIKLAAWFSLEQGGSGDLRWATLEQRAGRPVDEGRISICDVLAVRDTGVAVELSVKGQTQATTLEFGTPKERSTWYKYIELAQDVLTPESERAALESARSSHRQLEIEERRALNEERKKKLSENLGMRFTAEAMIARADATGGAPRR